MPIMEKKRPTYDLNAFKQSNFDVTSTAVETALEIGYDEIDIRRIVKTIEPSHFKKSMTSQYNHSHWQDVYNVPTEKGMLYVKFCSDVCTEFLLLSFKEK